MLILTRKPGESLYIGDNVKVTIVEMKGNQIRVGVDAPSTLRIYREEIYLQILEENKSAAEGISDAALTELSGGWKGVSRGSGQKPSGEQGQGAMNAKRSDVLLKRKSAGTKQ